MNPTSGPPTNRDAGLPWLNVKRIAVVPAYNEEPTVEEVLDRLYPLVDELVVVDDGSTDHTRKISRSGCRMHRTPRS